MYVFIDNIKQEKGMIIAFLFFSTLFIGLVIFIYPGDEAAVEQVTGFKDMGDWEAVFGMTYGEGGEYRYWLAFLLFSYIGILYTAIPALAGSNIFSKDNDENTLDFLMSNPVTRRKVLFEKISAVLLMSLGSMVYLFSVTYFFSRLISQNISIEILLASCIQLFTLLVFVALLSILFAVLFLDSGRAKRYIAIILVGSFVINMIVLFSKELEFLKYFQIFYYYDSASTILKPNLGQVVWDKAIYLLILSIVTFGLILIINEKRDLVPHFSHEFYEKKSKEKGIPLLLFFVGKFQNRYPSFVEQIQSDKLIFYMFALLMTISGLITPAMYPGDESWVGLSKAYGGMNILMDALLRNHGVTLSFMGYIATEGFGEFFLYLGLVTAVLGSKIIIRDQKSDILDLLFAQSVPISKIFNERLAAITLEIFMLFFFNYLAYIIGILISGYGYEYIPILGVGLFFTFLIIITMTYIIVMLCVFIKNPGKAVAIAAMAYYGTLLVFLVTYTIEQIRFLSTLTPFYWIDRIRILYDQTFILDDAYALILYFLVIIITYFISTRKITEREFF
ncbi:MAG: ABC transporter permease subunit [Candidatus Thorarchaeota archaeon]